MQVNYIKFLPNKDINVKNNLPRPYNFLEVESCILISIQCSKLFLIYYIIYSYLIILIAQYKAK